MGGTIIERYKLEEKYVYLKIPEDQIDILQKSICKIECASKPDAYCFKYCEEYLNYHRIPDPLKDIREIYSKYTLKGFEFRRYPNLPKWVKVCLEAIKKAVEG